MDNTRFAKKIFGLAGAVAERIPVNPEVIAAQAVLETGYGKSILCTKANNLYGIRACGLWKGPTYPIKNRQFDVNVGWAVWPHIYRLYPNWESCIEDYSNILLSIHGEKISDPSDTTKFLDLVMPDATIPGCIPDPRYRDKLITIIEKFKGACDE